MAQLNLSTIAVGVPAGANNASHATKSRFLMPTLATVSTYRKKDRATSDSKAMARNLPALTCSRARVVRRVKHHVNPSAQQIKLSGTRALVRSVQDA
jgi:hypothetical protein